MASRRLLLVEDSSTMRRMLSTMLKDEGYEVKTANDGAEGLAKAREEPRPELILTDYEMPELDGAGLCRAVKADKELRSIPVLMLTTLGEIAEQDRRARGRRRRLHPEAQEPRRFPGAVRPDPRAPADRRPARRAGRAQPLLEAAHKKLTFELELARKVQFALMPRPPKPRGVLAAGGPVHAGQPARRRRLRLLPAGEQPAGHPGGRRVGPRRQFGDALGDGQGAGGAAVDRGARAGRAAGRAGRRRRTVFPRRLLLHRVST